MRWTEALHIVPMAVTAVQAWLASPAAAGLTSLDNPWWRPGAPADRYANVLPRVDVLLPSEADVAAFFGRTFDDSMVKELVERCAARDGSW